MTDPQTFFKIFSTDKLYIIAQLMYKSDLFLYIQVLHSFVKYEII